MAPQEQVVGQIWLTVSWLRQSSRPETLETKKGRRTSAKNFILFLPHFHHPFFKKGYLKQNELNKKEISIHFIFQFLFLLFLKKEYKMQELESSALTEIKLT